MKKAVLLGVILGIVALYFTAKPYTTGWESDWRLGNKIIRKQLSFNMIDIKRLNHLKEEEQKMACIPN